MLSSLNKQWVVKNTNQKQTLLQKLLHNRNLKTEEEIDKFLNPDIERDLHDPFLMPDMKKAVERIKKAIDGKERIIVFGDYDVDGITGTAILIHTFRKLGAHVSYRLPHRMEDGYGLREKFIPEFIEAKVKLIITVDNGICCKHEIDVAKKHDIDVIVTDHHAIPEKIPEAFAILHPKIGKTKYPFDGLTGAGVAFKLAKALIITLLPEERRHSEIHALLDLACMGTIADFGPLRGENRAIVKFGLQQLSNTRWPGLSRLKHFAGIKGKIDTRAIGFMLGPRLNAAGRISHSYYALQLLLDDGAKSDRLAEHLENLNRKRQNIMEENFEEASVLAEKQIADGNVIIVLANAHWKSGVVGLIAAKLTERYGKPAFIMEDRGEELVGSARSIEGFSVVAAITDAKKYLSHFGGHDMAAGFELEKGNLEHFENSLHTYAKKHLSSKFLIPSLHLECELTPPEISLDTANMISEFEPFGIENETPRFLIKQVTPSSPSLVGKSKNHLKFIGSINGQKFDCIGFYLGHLFDQVSSASSSSASFDLACEVMAEEWNNRKKLTLKILDFHL